MTDLFPEDGNAEKFPSSDFCFPSDQSAVRWGRGVTTTGNIHVAVEFKVAFETTQSFPEFKVCLGSTWVDATCTHDGGRTFHFCALGVMDHHNHIQTKCVNSMDDVEYYTICNPTVRPTDPTTTRFVSMVWSPNDVNFGYVDRHRRFVEKTDESTPALVVTAAWIRHPERLSERDVFLVWDPWLEDKCLPFLEKVCKESHARAKILVMFEPPKLYDFKEWCARPEFIEMFDLVFGPIGPEEHNPKLGAYFSPTHHALFENDKSELPNTEWMMKSSAWKDDQNLIAINPISSRVSKTRIAIAEEILKHEKSARVFGLELLWKGERGISDEQYGGCGDIADKSGICPAADRYPAKTEMLRPFRFVFVAENVDDWMVSEKLTDALNWGNVAVYRGPNQIKTLLPELFNDENPAFIDYRDFDSTEALLEFLRHMTRDEYDTRVRRALDQRDAVQNGISLGATWSFIFATCARHGIIPGNVSSDDSCQHSKLDEINNRLMQKTQPSA